ncbi:MAG: metal-dependent hydrolase [Planctomycetota bacterium]
MDSVSQFVLGASLSAFVLGARTPVRRSLLWGGIVATLPDLDVLVDHGDAIANMTMHRAESHALLYLTALAPLLAFGIARLHGERALFGRWCVAVWLALVTHPLLDAMTIYGTQLLLPFTDHPFAVGSLFVIDPLYTLPLLVGCAWLWGGRGSRRAHRANAVGLVLSTLYAGWSVVAQGLVERVVRAQLPVPAAEVQHVVVTPAPLQTVLWRVLVVTEREAHEGFRSLLDGASPIAWTSIPRGCEWFEPLRRVPSFERLRRFSGDCVKVERAASGLQAIDLRMGQEPHYVFRFDVAQLAADGGLVPVAAPQRIGTRIPVGEGLAWLWARLFDPAVPTPR